MTGGFSVYGEGKLDAASTGLSDWAGTVGVGALWKATKRLRLDYELLRGLNRRATDWTHILRLNWEWRIPAKGEVRRDVLAKLCDGWTMTKFAVAVGIAIAAVGGTMAFLQHADNAEIRQEIGLLRNEVHQLARARAAAARVEGQVTAAFDSADAGGKAAERTELAKLREEISSLSKSTQDLTRFAQAAPCR